jgi:hypothetical protein
MVLYGLGRDDVDGYAARVRATDDAAARAAIANAFPESDELAIVLIGDAARIREGVHKFGPVTEMKLADPRFSPK